MRLLLGWGGRTILWYPVFANVLDNISVIWLKRIFFLRKYSIWRSTTLLQLYLWTRNTYFRLKVVYMQLWRHNYPFSDLLQYEIIQRRLHKSRMRWIRNAIWFHKNVGKSMLVPWITFSSLVNRVMPTDGHFYSKFRTWDTLLFHLFVNFIGNVMIFTFSPTSGVP